MGFARMMFFILSSFTFAACGTQNNGGLQNGPTRAVPTDLHLSVSAVQFNPLKANGEVQLGSGISEKFSGAPGQVSDSPCVKGTTFIWNDASWSVSGVFGALESDTIQTAYDSLNPFYFLDSFSEQGTVVAHSEYLDFATKSTDRDRLIPSRTVYAQLNPLKAALEDVVEPRNTATVMCKNKKFHSSFEDVVTSLEYGLAAAAILSIRAHTEDAERSWLAENGESIFDSVFELGGKSKLTPADVSARLAAIGINILYMQVLQLGGNSGVTWKALFELNCRNDNISGCRQLVNTMFNSLFDQSGRINGHSTQEQRREALKNLAPTGYRVRSLDDVIGRLK